MQDKDILGRLAPCGLDCTKCAGYAKGEIREHSGKLMHLLGAFERYAEKFSAFLPVFGNYPPFKEMLLHFSQANCMGCRNGKCGNPNCGVISCYQLKGVDFCFQCDEFPCNKTNFDHDLKERWIQMNNRMKEIGIQSYFEETRDLPRYR
jgi:hypothetical protein